MPTPHQIATATITGLLTGAGTLAALPAANPPASGTPLRTERPATGPNAALVYYSVWSTWNAEDQAVVANTVNDLQPGKALPQDLHRVLTANKSGIERLIKAASFKRCDFELDYSEGFDLLLPHLQKLRSTARLLVADAKRCLAEGNADAAADRYAAVFGVARHASGDRVLISSLVAIAIASLPESDLVGANVAASLTPAGRAKVRAELERVMAVEAFGLKRAIQSEREMAIATLAGRYEGNDAGRKLVEEVLVPVMGIDAGDPARAKAIDRLRAMDADALRREVARLDPFYAQVLRVWDATDAPQQIEALNARADRGEFGDLLPFLLPAFGKCRTSQTTAEQTLKRIHTALAEPTQPSPNPAEGGARAK